MKVLIEGIDRVGKTILANRIKKELDIPVYHDIHKFPFERKANIEKMWTLLNAIKCFGVENVVLDRFHATEYVYGKMRFECEYEDELKELDDEIYMMGFIVIYVKPINVERSSNEHGSDLFKHEQEFMNFWSNSRNVPIVVDYNDIANDFEKIKEKLK